MKLVKAGYGSFFELDSADCEVILDMLEFEDIQNDITSYEMEQARNGS